MTFWVFEKVAESINRTLQITEMHLALQIYKRDQISMRWYQAMVLKALAII